MACRNVKRLEEYESLRKAGLGYREIAKIYGCTYQNISQYLAKENRSLFKGFTTERCVYPGLRNWLNENQCTVPELIRKVYGYNLGGSTSERYRRLLRGETLFNMKEIDALIAITGLTYEVLFAREADS